MIKKNVLTIDEDYTPYEVLILEDDPTRIPGLTNLFKLVGANVIWTNMASECIAEMKKQKFDIIFLDHDLGGQVYVKSGENTGYEVALWLSKNVDKKPTQQLYTHTLNPVGRQNILNIFGYGIYAPFVWLRNVQF